MKLRALFSILAAAVVLTGCEKENYSPQQQHNNTTTVLDAGEVIKGNVIVKFHEVPQTKSVTESLPEIEISRMEKLFPENPKFAARHKEHGLDRWYKVTFNPEVSVSTAYGAFKSMEIVETVDFVPVKQKTSVPFNDPYLTSYQWHFNNSGTQNGYVAGMDINLYKAWEIETGNKEVIVAVIDEGVQYNHADLARNMWVNEAEKNGVDGIDDDNNGYTDDIYGYNFCANEKTGVMHGAIEPGDHGTFVAGIIAAVNGNNIMGCGIAGGNGTAGSGARIMTCQTFNALDDPAYDAAAMAYAADNGAVISQNSWGYPTLDTTPAFMVTAIDYFNKYAGIDENGNQVGPMAGGITIFAAGNHNTEISVPAMLDQVVAVAATGPAGKMGSYSCYGKWVDVSAPGGEVTPSAIFTYSTIANNAFGGQVGTSMACPHASGVAALIISRYGGQGFTNTQLWEALINSADHDKLYDVNPEYKAKKTPLINLPDRLGAGALDAYKAVTYFGEVNDNEDNDDQDNENTPAPVETIEVDDTKATSSSITIRWAATATNSNPTYGYNLFYSKQSLAQFNPEQQDNNVKSVFVDGSSAKVGEMISATIGNLEWGTTYYIRIQSVSEKNNVSALSEEITAATKVNLPPVISPAEKIATTLKATHKQSFEYTISDPDNDNLTETFSSGSSAASAKRNGNTITVTIDALKADAGTYNATLAVTDVAGNTTTAEIEYTILPNNKPTSTKGFGNLVLDKGENTTFNLEEYFADADGDKLSYIISTSESSVAEYSVQGNTITIYGTSYGTTKVDIAAKDAKNAISSTNSMQILVRNTKEAVDIFPATVQTTLNIRAGADSNVDILITGASGATVYSKSSVATGPFNPHTINASEWGAGVYSVQITSNGTKYQKTIVKL